MISFIFIFLQNTNVPLHAPRWHSYCLWYTEVIKKRQNFLKSAKEISLMKIGNVETFSGKVLGKKLTGKLFKIIYSNPMSLLSQKQRKHRRCIPLKVATFPRPPESTTSRSCASFAIKVLTASSLTLSLLMNNTNMSTKAL